MGVQVDHADTHVSGGARSDAACGRLGASTRSPEAGARSLRRIDGPESSGTEGRTVKEACGVFGVYAPGRGVAHLTFDGIYALQHRGQESAGMAVSDGQTITVVKDMGLVTTVFDERTLSGLPGHLAIGHTRYSTHGSSDWAAAQPVYRPVGRAGFALGHNGNLTNTAGPGREGRDAAGDGGHRQRRRGRAAGPGLQRPRRCAPRGPAGRAAGGAADGGGRLLPRPARRRPPLRGARSPRLPAAVPGPARSGRPPGGLGAGLGVAGPRRHRRHLRARARAGRAGDHRRGRGPLRAAVPDPSGSSPTCASSSSSTSPGPTPSSTAARCTAPAAGWASCWPSRPRSTPTW